jgi:polyribonucleotide nucleotidyltransferase
MLGAVVFGHEQMQIAIKTINEMVAAVGKPKWDWKPNAASAELDAAVAAQAQKALSDAYLITVKQDRYAKIGEIKAAATLALSGGETPKYNGRRRRQLTVQAREQHRPPAHPQLASRASTAAITRPFARSP